MIEPIILCVLIATITIPAGARLWGMVLMFVGTCLVVHGEAIQAACAAYAKRVKEA
jgi:hypothetical protein